MRKLTFLFAFLLTMVGGTRVWADTLTENFDNISFTKDGVATTSWDGNGLSNGWIYQGSSGYLYGDGSSYPGFGLTTGYNYTGKALVSNYGSSEQATYLIIPEQLVGTVTFNVKRTSSSYTGKVSLYKVTSTESGGTTTYTIGNLVGSYSSSSSTWTDGSISLGDNGVMVAINLFRITLDNFTATIYEDAGAIAKPTNFAVTGTTYNSASFSWTAGGTESAWQIVYGVPGFDKDKATPVDVTTNPCTLSGLSESTTYEAYLRAKSGDNVSSWTSKVTFTTPAQYPAPTGFAAGAYTATTQTFSWTNGSTETAWQIVYSENADFDNNAATPIDVTTNPFTLTGLTAETTYYACIRADYGSSHYSAWSEKISFTPSATMNTTINDGTTKNSYIPVYGYNIDNTSYNKCQFVIPSSSISALVNREITKLTFYTDKTTAVSWGSNVFDVYMKESDATTVSTTMDRTGTKVFTGTLSIKADGTMEVILDEGFPYSGENLQIGFDMTTKGSYTSAYFYGVSGSSGCSMYVSGGSGNSSSFLPKMTITSVPYVAPAVKKPSALTASNITATSAQLTWTDGEDGLSSWQIAYDTNEDFDPAIEGTKVSADSNPYTLTGLTAETTYYAYVRAKKGEEYSTWSNKVTFEPTASVGLTVHDGSGTNSFVPINGNYCEQYLKCEFVMPAEELSNMDGGTIKKMTFYLSTPASDSWGNASFQVFLKEIDGTTVSSYTGTEGGTIVYEGSLDGTQSTMTIDFTTPYSYNGGNLLIGVYNTVKGTYKSCYFYGETVNGTSIQGNNSSSLGSVSATQRNFLPKTTFTYFPGAPKGILTVSTYAIDFGKITSESIAADKQKTFTISNTGKANLTGITVSYDDEYATKAFSLSGISSNSIDQNGQDITVNVTMDATDVGYYTGIITISADDNTSKTITVTGRITDEWEEDFSGNALPAGWSVEGTASNWTFASGEASGTYEAGGHLVTPGLKVESGKTMTFKAKAKSYNTDVIVKYVKDGGSLSDAIINENRNTQTDYETYTIEGLETGIYRFYIATENLYLDEFEGFKLVPTLIQTETPSFTTGEKDVVLSRTYLDGWNTICLPFAVSDIEGKFGTGAKAYAFTGNDNGQLTFGKVNTMEAATPYLMNIPNGTSLGDIVFYNASIASTEAGYASFNSVTFQGSYAPIAAGSLTGKYVLTTQGKIAKAGSSASMDGYRAYFVNASGARLSLSLEDENGTTTAIGFIGDGEVKIQNVYNLQGQRVNNIKKGHLYIVDGKKAIVK